MPGYYRPIPEYIATSLLLTAEEKLFYGLIASLVSEKERGFCWASNEFLSERERVNPRTIQRWIRKLVKHKFVIVELVHNRERKMWTPETWGNRENLRRAYGSDSIDETENFQKKIDYLKSNVLQDLLRQTSIENLDFEEFLKRHSPKSDDFVFLDPPYDSEFSTYAQNEFNKADQIRLASHLINDCRAKWMIVIKNTEFIASLYSDKGLNIKPFDKTYLVSFMNRNDKHTEHLLITNY